MLVFRKRRPGREEEGIETRRDAATRGMEGSSGWLSVNCDGILRFPTTDQERGVHLCSCLE